MLWGGYEDASVASFVAWLRAGDVLGVILRLHPWLFLLPGLATDATISVSP
jgi:hypothetical protein